MKCFYCFEEKELSELEEKEIDIRRNQETKQEKHYFCKNTECYNTAKMIEE